MAKKKQGPPRLPSKSAWRTYRRWHGRPEPPEADYTLLIRTSMRRLRKAASLHRAAQQIKYKRVQWIVMLLPCRTDTKWWHRSVMAKAKTIRLIEGRLRFVGAAGAAPFPSVIVVYHRNRRFYPLTIGPSINARGKG